MERADPTERFSVGKGKETQTMTKRKEKRYTLREIESAQK
jgi:hypothetical protein